MDPKGSKHHPAKQVPSVFTNQISQALQKLEEQRSDKPGYTVRKIAKQLRRDYEDDPSFELQIRLELQRMADTGSVVRNTLTRDVWKRCANKHIVKSRRRSVGQEESSMNAGENVDNGQQYFYSDEFDDYYSLVGGEQVTYEGDTVDAAASRTPSRDSSDNVLDNLSKSLEPLGLDDPRCLAMSEKLVKNYVERCKEAVVCTCAFCTRQDNDPPATSTQRQTGRSSSLKRTHSDGDQERAARNKSPKKRSGKDEFESGLDFDEEGDGWPTEKGRDDQSDPNDSYNYDLDEYPDRDDAPDQSDGEEDGTKKSDCVIM